MATPMPHKQRASAERGTSARTRANRRNALKSTGPKTAAGKEQSRRNALRHGLTAKTLADNALTNDMMADASSLAPGVSKAAVAAIADILSAQHKLAAVRGIRAATFTVVPMLIVIAPETIPLPTWRPEPCVADLADITGKGEPAVSTASTTFLPDTEAICNSIMQNQRLFRLLRRYESCAYRARTKAAENYYLIVSEEKTKEP